MKTINQVEELSVREHQQRKLAERAKSPEVKAFHTDLADHYARLAADARGLLGMVT